MLMQSMRSLAFWASISLLFAGLAVAQEERQSKVIRAGETFVAEEDVIYRDVDTFRRMAEEIAEARELKVQIEELRQQVALLEKAIERRKEASAADQEAIAAQSRGTDAWRDVADGIEARFHRCNDELLAEQKKKGPLFVSGPTIGGGLAQTADRTEPAVFVGWGVTFNVKGKR